MATKRKKSQAGLKSPRPVRQQHSQQAEPAAANDELLLFKFSFGNVPGEPVEGVIGVVAPNPEEALTRARALIASMQMGASITDATTRFYDDGISATAMLAAYARAFFGAPYTITLNQML